MEIIGLAFADYDGRKKLGRNAALATAVVFAVLQSVFCAPVVGSTKRSKLRGRELIRLVMMIPGDACYKVRVRRNVRGIAISSGVCAAAVVYPSMPLSDDTHGNKDYNALPGPTGAAPAGMQGHLRKAAGL